MHHGLFRSQSLKRIGGYYGGFRLGYDMLVTNLLLMTGKLSYVDEPLYHRHQWPESLTHRRTTGFGSKARLEAVQQMRQLYRQAFKQYSQYLGGAIDINVLTRRIRQICSTTVPTDHHRELRVETKRLKNVMVNHRSQSKKSRFRP